MNNLNLDRAKAKLRTLQTLLHLCRFTWQGKSLSLTCSAVVAEQLKPHYQLLGLKFEHIEEILVNGTVVFSQSIAVEIEPPSISAIYGCNPEPTELLLPVLTEGMKVTPEFMAAMFPD